MTQELVLNAVAALLVRGLVVDDQKVDVPLKLYRASSKPSDIVYRTRHTQPVPDRLPSNLPPPGNLELEFTVSEPMARGRIGTVFPAELFSDTSLSDLYIPPVVMKVCRGEYADRLAKEMWFCEELESVQGSCIPRCYGYFEVQVPSGWRTKVPLRVRNKGFNREREQRDLGTYEELGKVSILLLERLGELLPLGEPLPEGAAEDIHDIYQDLAELAIESLDIRYTNILHAPICPPGLPSLPSPYHHRTYQWRVLDFDVARKQNGTVHHLTFSNGTHIGRLLDNLPCGDIINPED